MDFATSSHLSMNYIYNQCGNEGDILSPCTSSSLSTGSVVLNPGTPHQSEVCSLSLPSHDTPLPSSVNGDTASLRSSGTFTSNTRACAEHLLCVPFSSSGLHPTEHSWGLENSFYSYSRNDIQFKHNPVMNNAKQTVPLTSSCSNEEGMYNGASSMLCERGVHKQHFNYQSGRFLHNTGKQENSSMPHISQVVGFPNASHGSRLAFGGNLTPINNQIAASERFVNSYMHGNFSNPLQKGLEQTLKQPRLQHDTHIVPDFSLSTSGSPLPMFRFDGAVASNPAPFLQDSSFQSLEQTPQQCHDLQCQKQSVSNMIPGEMPSNLQMLGFSQQKNGQDMTFSPHSFRGGFANNCFPSSECVSVSHYQNLTPCTSENRVRPLRDSEKQELLLLYFHARHCSRQEGLCLNDSCKLMKRMIDHMPFCQKTCNFCVYMHALLLHYRYCQDNNCLVCYPVRKLLSTNPPARHHVENLNFNNFGVSDDDTFNFNPSAPGSNTVADVQPFTKRMKTECHSFEKSCQQQTPRASEPDNSCANLDPGDTTHFCKSVATASTEEMKPCDNSSQGSSMTVGQIKFQDSETTDEVLPIHSRSLMVSNLCEKFLEKKSSAMCKSTFQEPDVHNAAEPTVLPGTQQDVIEGEKVELQADTSGCSQLKEKCSTIVAEVDTKVETKSRKSNIKGVSLVESFTLEQALEHLRSLKQWIGLSKAKIAKNQAVDNVGDKNLCQLCGMGDLLFEPPPVYCVKCYGRIKHNRAYHTMTNSGNMTKGAVRIYLCNPCFNGSHGDSITYIGGVLSKAKLEKKRNDVQILELWVQCDKCNAWQHQTCALFNSKRNVAGQADYTCPKCYIQEIGRGERIPLPHGIILGAHDLPRSKLSDHIEMRLLMRLEQERQERAKNLQKKIDEVPGAEDLVVRVVSSVDKKLEVKQLFRQIFEEENYPAEFPYKSKAVLLFQKIEGAEVCLFGMYVQEYGSECSHPNQRRVCLAYLDSVKYFRPDVKTVTGEALRTFVYHEILIGYLDYCKLRGFTSCHIWSCPPLKQEDFILNCHPEIQKTPKPDKLREWYLAMIRKAVKENIVVENTKLYDFFFMPMGECKSSVTAARLPYFDGDYWPGCADDLLQSLQQIEDGKEPQKKGRMTITKRSLKAARHGSLTDSPSKDSLLMFKLGEVIRPMKDDLIIIHLHHACNHCCQMIISGKRWECDLCKKFQLCDKCYCAEQKLDEKLKHPVNCAVKHSFHPVEVTGVPAVTNDEDDNLQSEFFDSRISFLNLCQGNHYQFDTLRRAKHSTLMILYHLHNPTVPAFVSSCFYCHSDVEVGQGWHCETCPDYDVCESCYQQDSGVHHTHELVRHILPGSHDVLQSKGSRQRQAPQIRSQPIHQIQDLLDLLSHASKCCAAYCSYPCCRNVKGLFHHGANCEIRTSGGCPSCKKMWYILHLHARACKDGPECRVPRCRDLKDHLKKMESQSNFRRRVGAMERIRQQELSGALGDSE